ncbi:unnamed protein product [Clonostachys byssicola]|uniref:Uncharacterized protein n=1 Tax=Clonostachys byssicola TaxID=160290 RepID=A0A9N9YC15_9HYPO|nr:unnamed protein product [Clonostachys byssicola]
MDKLTRLASESTIPQRCASLTRNFLALTRRGAVRILVLALGLISVIIFIKRSEDLPFNLTEEYQSWFLDNTLDNATIQAIEYSKPIQEPYKNQFWEVGLRLKQVNQWLSEIEQKPRNKDKLHGAVESVIAGLFPFLRTYSQSSPLAALRKSFRPGSRGIVIPVGGSENAIRYAGHLITSLRVVLGCTLPIQIAYAGDGGLSENDKQRILQVDGATDVTFLDVLSVFDDSTLKLADGGWAIKAFAALGSDLEQVILLDSDAVFLQKPDVLFEQHPYIQDGAYLFHDRLLWQHAFADRHAWFKDQIKEPSPAMAKSLVWTQDYAEECDSGVVVLDKSRPDVLMGLLHIAWQNTHAVREEITYKITYGDKESWWLGLELAGSGYEFEAHYGAILGWSGESIGKPAPGRVCSFVIAHVDGDDNLIWYNGGLLKNKLTKPDEYDVPEVWMIDGTWEKGGSKQDMSCMYGKEVKQLTDDQRLVLGRSIEGAKVVDRLLASSKVSRTDRSSPT